MHIGGIINFLKKSLKIYKKKLRRSRYIKQKKLRNILKKLIERKNRKLNNKYVKNRRITRRK
jgi:hypothetical protein